MKTATTEAEVISLKAVRRRVFKGVARCLQPPMNTSKNILRSKTIWVQILTVIAALLPPVQGWLMANPVEFLAVLAAVNVIVRFVTSGKVTIFSDNVDADKPSGGMGLWVLLAMGTAAALGGLPSCKAGEYPLSGALTYRDAASGAKGGLVFAPGKPVRGTMRVPVRDPETGEVLGTVDFTSGK
jgi:hypothetical protein